MNKHIPFFILILSFSFAELSAQQPTEEWVARYQGPSNDAYDPIMQVDKQGNSYVAGTHVINDSINILCAKYNTSGAQLWATLYKYPGQGYFTPSGLALDSSGNAYIISDFGPGYTSPLNGLIVKFNSLTGSPVWAKTYIGQYGWSAFRGIKIDRLNNICITGWSDSSHLVLKYDTEGDTLWVRKYHPPSCREVSRFACTLDDSLNIIFTGIRTHYYPPYGSYDSLLVVKYSSGGVLRWESTYSSGATNANWGAYITNDQNGNLYVGGGTTPSGYAVFLTLKYDRNGVRQWVSIYDAPGSGSDYLRSIVFDRNNNALFVTGGAVANGRGVAATIKYNILTGDIDWVRTDSGSCNMASSRAITVDSIGNIFITGETYNFPSYVPYDILTVKYSMTGNQIWRMTYNGPYNGMDIGKCIGTDKLNNIYVLGTSQSGFQISDYVVIKYDQLAAIEPISNVTPNEYKLLQNYPNPFNPVTVIKYDLPKDVNINIRIFDYLGREVAALVSNIFTKAGSYEINWNASEFASGVYVYRIEAGEYFCTKKMVLLK